jgi:hypothetical protein
MEDRGITVDELTKPSTGSIARGLGIGALLTLGGALASALLMVIYVGFVLFFAIGLAQLTWVIPAYRRCTKRGETETAKGLLIVAGIVFLLNASCWGVLANTNFR